MSETKIETAPRQPVLGLSLTQLVGGGAAAATAALLGSRLGTTGTIIGAAVASIVSAVAGALYTASITRTKQVVVATREMLPTTIALRRTDLPAVADQPEGTEADVVEVDEPTDQPDSSLWSRVRWGYVALATVAVFVIGALVITGIEAVSGNAVSGNGRTTFGDVVSNDGGADRSTQTPSESPSTTPSETGSSTPTPTPSTTPTPSASPTDQATGGTGTPTPTPSPSATTTP